MLENANRQLIFVILAAVAATALLVFQPVNLGLDLSGGVQLIYEIDLKRAEDDGVLSANPTQAEVDAIMDQQIQIVAERVDPTGTLEALVTRRGQTGILIELPRMTETETRAVESRIENLGRLELRIVADEAYTKNGITFDLAAEKQRLSDWLEADDGAGREMVNEKPERIRLFNTLSADEGGPLAGGALAWYPVLNRPSVDNPEIWSRTESQPGNLSAETPNVAAFTATDLNGGVVGENAPAYLLEFMPINMDEDYFSGEDLDAAATRRSLDQLGKPCISYRMRADKIDAYADWSGEYIQQRSAIILNGEVHSAPTFISEIRGSAQITSQNFTDRQVDELVGTLRTGSLKVKLIQQSRDVIGATLGQTSIELAFRSLLVGAALVMIFILAYYRLAGIVAFAGLALNILLILGTVVALRATLTLPGLAGLVLTMGMAIDANILIYERIREELARGKEIVQACRTGFDRAIVTILDANITTFIAGVVLYNVGVGPIRGFAVTLMIGIVTTLFTAFFVSRLVFHYLLETNKLRDFKTAGWLRNTSFNFLRHAKTAVVLSVVAVIASIALFTERPNDEKFAIDFTGGANLKVSLREPTAANDIRELLAADTDYSSQFPKPIVNTVGEEVDGKSTRFAIRVKLTDELRQQIDDERRADPDNYHPPYLVELRRVLGARLVDDAFSDATIEPNRDSNNTDFASIRLHFAKTISGPALAAKLQDVGTGLVVTPLQGEVGHMLPAPELEQASDYRVEFDVPKQTNASALFGMLEGTLVDMVAVDGSPAPLSQPVPESSEIGGRMVGELRTSAINALVIALFVIVLFIRVRFHEYKYGLAAVVALVHDVLVTMGVLVFVNWMGWVDAELDLAIIAAFLTIIGYSINDTIVIFDRVRENLNEQSRLGEKINHAEILNRSINQTLSRTILTTTTTVLVVLTQFVFNYGSGTSLEGFSFALLVGLLSGTYSTIFIASPVMLWLWRREGDDPAADAVTIADKGTDAAVTAPSGA